MAATEFALIVPVFFIPLFFGMLEASQLLTANRRMTTTANSIADIIAQTENISRAELDAVISWSADMLGEDDLSNISVRVLSIVRDPDNLDNLLVHWARDKDGDESATNDTYTELTSPDRVHPDSSVIIVEMTYQYDSLITEKIFNSPYVFSRNSIRWPRLEFHIQLCDDVQNSATCTSTPQAS